MSVRVWLLGGAVLAAAAAGAWRQWHEPPTCEQRARCAECHAERLPHWHTEGLRHPGASPAARDEHARLARGRAESCVGCHAPRFQVDCATCHQPGGWRR